MTAKELASLMLEWGELQEQADGKAAQIKAVVLELEQTQTVGNVRASFRNPRKSYDYITAGRAAPASIVEAHTTPKTDWRKVCKDAGIKAPFSLSGRPSVALKLLE